MEGVRPHVTLRVPFGILLAADQGQELREVPDPSAVAKEAEPPRGTVGPEDELPPLFEDPLPGQRAGLDLAAQGDGLRRDIEIEAGGELHPAKHAQRVLREPLAGVAEDAGLEVLEPPKGVDHLTRQGIEGDRVDGEIAAPRGLLRCHVGVGEPFELLRTAAALGRAPGDRYVDGNATDLDHPEGATHQVDREPLGEKLQQARGWDPVDLDVEIRGGEPERAVANASTHQQRTTTRRPHCLADGPTLLPVLRVVHPDDDRKIPGRHCAPLSSPGA